MIRESNPLGIRLWHWLDGIVVLGLLGTYFLRETLLSVQDNAAEFTNYLATQGLSLSETQARQMAHLSIHHLWDWHVDLGYALTALLLWRVVLFFMEPSTAFSQAYRGFREFRQSRSFFALHGMGVKLLYSLFYLAQTIMVLSGLSMVFTKWLGIPRDLHHSIHEVHETIMWFFVVFVVLHVLGVIVAENTTDPGIVSGMIHGKPKLKNPR